MSQHPPTSARRVYRRSAGFPALLAAVLTAVPAIALAQPGSSDLSHASLADLMNVEVTSAFRKGERVLDTPAAVTIITADRIRRSGATSIAEALRLAPGVQVARINGNKWAVSVRGFNDLYSNKLLVLVDGRTIYTQLFSGVVWDSDPVPVDEIDQIEIVRGPAGAAWGVNAVNGAINIVTKKSAVTGGTTVSASTGTADTGNLSVSHSGAFKSSTYRAYSQWSSVGASVRPAGVTPSDGGTRLISGVRFDGVRRNDTWFIAADAAHGSDTALWLRPTVTGDLSDLLTGATSLSSADVVGRWKRRLENTRWFQVQASADVDRRDEPVGLYKHSAGEITFDYHADNLKRHEIVVGAGLRETRESLDGREGYRISPAAATQAVLNAFAQDEISIVNGLDVTVGMRVEAVPHLDAAFEPTLRMMWSPVANQRVWAAVSRGERAPSQQDRAVSLTFPAVPSPFGLPIVTSMTGNPFLESESVVTAEAGYRCDIGRFNLDANVFHSSYDRLRTSEAQTPLPSLGPAGPFLIVPVTFGNGLRADTSGIEASAQWRPTTAWHLDGGYTLFDFTPHLGSQSTDATAAGYDGAAPAHQWFFRSTADLPHRIQFDVTIQRVGRLRVLQVPAYTRVDARVELPLRRALSLIASGQNLTDDRHGEFSGVAEQLLWTEQPRSARVALVWRF